MLLLSGWVALPRGSWPEARLEKGTAELAGDPSVTPSLALTSPDAVSARRAKVRGSPRQPNMQTGTAPAPTCSLSIWSYDTLCAV